MNYHEIISRQKAKNINNIEKQLPTCCNEFLSNKFDKGKNIDTIEAYAENIKTFYDYISERKNVFKGKKPLEVRPSDFQYVTLADVSSFVEYLSSYSSPGREKISNSRESKRHKLVVIRQFFRFLAERYKIENSEVMNMKAVKLLPKADTPINSKNKRPKIEIHEDLRPKMSRKQREIDDMLNVRDRLICQLYFKEELSAPEISGIDIKDIDAESCALYITKKDGRQEKKKLDRQTAEAVLQYTNESGKIGRMALRPEDTDALFLSRKTHDRITPRAILYTVRKYSDLYSKLKEDKENG